MPSADEQDRQLARAAELLAQEADRDDSHDEGRHAARQRVDEAEIGRLVGAIEEQHVACAQHRARREIGPALRRRDGDEGNETQRQGELGERQHPDEGESIAVGFDQRIPRRVDEGRSQNHQEHIDRHNELRRQGGQCTDNSRPPPNGRVMVRKPLAGSARKAK